MTDSRFALFSSQNKDIFVLQTGASEIVTGRYEGGGRAPEDEVRGMHYRNLS